VSGVHKLTTAVGLWLALCAVAPAQDYPAQPVRLIVPYAAGGGVDAMARFLTKGLEKRLGQTVVIENRGGSATTTAATYVARQPADGYTLLIGTSTTYAIAVSLYKKLGYYPAKDFTPIALVAAVPFALVVNPKLPVTTVMELVALAKSKPGELNYASAGVGAPHHSYAELLKSMTGIDIRNVSYRGGGPALQDVVAGHAPITFADAGNVLSQIRSGQVRALGVTVSKRLDTMPEVPTIHEAGVTGYEANSWIAVVAPPNLPPAIGAKLNAALTDVVNSDETRKFFAGVGWVPTPSTQAELGSYIKSEIARWAKVVEAAGAKGVE
jgi:tripartite-type tricarboxylate transporter receptor subunit TctC